MKQICLVTLIAFITLTVGCQKQDEITSYTVSKDASQEDSSRPNISAAPAKPTRMLAAIVPGSPQNWFFKMTGEPDQVKAEFENFIQFMKSVTLKNDKPEWKLPDNWTQEPGNSMRFATLKVKDTAPALELSVMPLPARDDQTEDLLSNINRWRGQVGLDSISADDIKAATGKSPALDTELFTLKSGDETISVVSLNGKMAGNPMSRAPFASGMMGGPGGPAAEPSNPAAAAAQIKYETPEGWQPGRSGGMRKAAFNITGGGETGEVTVIDLTGESNPLLLNVNRWRGQVGLKDITEAELPQQSEQLKAGDLEATYVKLIGPEDAKPRIAILGAIIYRDNLAWFVKFTGPVPLAEQEQDRFKQFVQSIRFE